MQRFGIKYDCNIYDICPKMRREKRIPFDVCVDPFYSESNTD